MDRYDNLTFKNKLFIHKDAYVSEQADLCTIECGKVFKNFFSNRSRGSNFGVNKKEPKISGCGWSISKIYNGGE